jgi:hypothetical protein
MNVIDGIVINGTISFSEPQMLQIASFPSIVEWFSGKGFDIRILSSRGKDALEIVVAPHRFPLPPAKLARYFLLYKNQLTRP